MRGAVPPTIFQNKLPFVEGELSWGHSQQVGCLGFSCDARVAYSPLNALFQSNFIGLRLLSHKKYGSGAWG